ncbi:uncharacterized protein LOC126898833 [Daktulosphaira vitifoliae]|uniref:uncharacterized protein LOC126898833 n=1 Tax=Daktulosphaira vitifoliae TaxID=58002 RepID=UPI0021AAE690|nr:uncharacterized protein LOC126898833 [Daktulosphaira vitifoliae]
MKTVAAIKLGLCSSVFSTAVLASVCFLVVWSYWYFEFDADCAVHDCKCILFGTSFAGGVFVGGQLYRCRYVWYSLTVSASFAALACIAYGLGILCSVGTARQRRRSYDQAPTMTDDDITRKSSQVSKSKIGLVIFSILMAVNTMIASIILTNGYISTCQQYVHRVNSFLLPTGKMVDLISNRLSCETIYDFLDYLQPPSHEATLELIRQHRPNPRNDIINTWNWLTTSIIMSWLNTILWVLLPVTFYFL